MERRIGKDGLDRLFATEVNEERALELEKESESWPALPIELIEPMLDSIMALVAVTFKERGMAFDGVKVGLSVRLKHDGWKRIDIHVFCDKTDEWSGIYLSPDTNEDVATKMIDESVKDIVGCIKKRRDRNVN